MLLDDAMVMIDSERSEEIRIREKNYEECLEPWGWWTVHLPATELASCAASASSKGCQRQGQICVHSAIPSEMEVMMSQSERMCSTAG